MPPRAANPADSLTLTLEYPAAWQRPRNPLAPAAAAFTRAFLAEAGLVPDAATAEKLDRMDVAGYGGWPFGQADLGTLETVTAFLTLWILHDDLLEGGAAPQAEEIVRAVRGEGPRPDDPFHRAWWELGRRSQGLGRAALARHCERFRDWLASLEVEAGLVRRERSGDPCSFEEYMAWRRINVGVLPTLDFLELDLGESLPVELWQDPRLNVLERLAADLVALQNDLYGYRKDLRDRWPNAVRQLEAAGRSPAAAFAWVARHHNQLVEELDRQGRAFVRQRGSALLAAWWQRLSSLVAGFACWHAEAARYGGDLLLGGIAVRLAIDQPVDTAAVCPAPPPPASGAGFFA